MPKEKTRKAPGKKSGEIHLFESSHMDFIFRMMRVGFVFHSYYKSCFGCWRETYIIRSTMHRCPQRCCFVLHWVFHSTAVLCIVRRHIYGSLFSRRFALVTSYSPAYPLFLSSASNIFVFSLEACEEKNELQRHLTETRACMSTVHVGMCYFRLANLLIHTYIYRGVCVSPCGAAFDMLAAALLPNAIRPSHPPYARKGKRKGHSLEQQQHTYIYIYISRDALLLPP